MAQTASGKTVEELISEAGVDINYSATFADDNYMLQWFNEARFEIVKDGHAMQTSEEITLVANTVEYTPVTDFLKIVAAQYINASGVVVALLPGSPAMVGRVFNVDLPNYLYEFNGKIGVYPSLSSVTTEKVRLFEIERVPDLVLTDLIDTPALFDQSIKKFIVAKHMWRDKKFASFAQAMASFENDMAKVRLELHKVDQ